MVYQPNKPLPGDNLSVSQGDINQNFTVANTEYGVNHYPFDDGTANHGKHKKVSMPATSLPVSVSGEIVLFSSTGSSGTELHMVREGVPGTDVALTTAGVASPLRATRGYSWLPGNILLQWGLSAVVSGTGNVSFVSGGGVNFANVVGFLPIVTLTPFRNSSNVDTVYLTATSNTNFSYNNTSSGGITHVYWHAIGPI